LGNGTNFAYVGSRYAVFTNGTGHSLAFAPYHVGVPQMAASVTATQTVGAPTGAGFGVGCYRGTGASRIRYELLVTVPGTWYVERSHGDGLGVQPTILRRGTSAIVPGASPITVEGVCATLSDGRTTRLVLFANGQRLTDLTDAQAGLPGPGWLAALDVDSRKAVPTRVTATHFGIQNVAGQG